MSSSYKNLKYSLFDENLFAKQTERFSKKKKIGKELPKVSHFYNVHT